MLKLGELKVLYHVEERIDSALDKALTDALKKQGWSCWASGCDLTTGERDLAFDKEQLSDEEE